MPSDNVQVTYNKAVIFRGTKVDAIVFLFENNYTEPARVHPQLRRKYGDQRSKQIAAYKQGIEIKELNDD